MNVTDRQSRANEFRDQFSKRVLVADGAMGTVLYSKGVFINRCFDELNLSAPSMVREIHQEYVRCGADILEANTFGANRLRLGSFGFAEKLREINAAGVRLAREAAKDSAFVAGSIGPLGVRIEPLGPTSFEEARDYFREQANALLEAGIDLMVLETFSDLNEVREAIFAAREAAGPEMVIIAQVTIDDDGRMLDGSTIETFTERLDEWPADAIGLNCSVGPKSTLETIERMAQYSGEAADGDAERGRAVEGGRAQYLPVLAGIHGAVRAPIPAERREGHRRLLRHHAGAHQADPRGGEIAEPIAFGRDRRGGRAGSETEGAAQGSIRSKITTRCEARRRAVCSVCRDPAAARHRRRRRKLKAPARAQPMASIASMSRTVLAPARA